MQILLFPSILAFLCCLMRINLFYLNLIVIFYLLFLISFCLYLFKQDGILVLMTNMYAIIFCLKETPVRIFFCVAISMGLLASGINDVIHYTRIAKFCKNDAPNLDYAMDVEEVKCHSIGFLIFSASEVIVMIFVLINQAVIGIYYYKTRDRKSQD